MYCILPQIKSPFEIHFVFLLILLVLWDTYTMYFDNIHLLPNSSRTHSHISTQSTSCPPCCNPSSRIFATQIHWVDDLNWNIANSLGAATLKLILPLILPSVDNCYWARDKTPFVSHRTFAWDNLSGLSLWRFCAGRNLAQYLFSIRF